MIAALLAIALITAGGGTLAVWVQRQLLDTRQWTATSARMLADPKVEPAIAHFLVSQLLTGLNLHAVVAGALPEPARSLADPIVGRLRASADTAAVAVLATPAARSVWSTANRLAHAQLIALLDGGGSVFATRDGTVTLDLHALVALLLARAGTAPALGAAVAGAGVPVPGDLGAALARRLRLALPASSGRLVIMRSSQLHAAQRVVAAIRGLALVLTIVPLALCVVCLALAAGWRWIVLRRIGLGALVLGAVLVLGRRVLGATVIDSLVSAPSVKPAATSAWLIATTLLRDIAIALAAGGLVVALVAWAAAVSGRRAPVRR